MHQPWRLLFNLLLTSTTFALEQIPLQDAVPEENVWFHNQSSGVSLDIWTKNGTRNATAPYLSGMLFEDIAHSGDGGLYAELLRNRAFQGSGVRMGRDDLLPGVVIKEAENSILPFAPTLHGWYPIGDARLSLDLLHPLSDALQVALQVDIPWNATGEVGFKNDGWWGMDVSPQVYNSSFYAQSNGFRWNSTLTYFNLSLRDNLTDEVFAESSIQFKTKDGPVPYMYRNYSTQLIPNVIAPSISNSFALTMDAEQARGQTFYFSFLSLFPQTYKNRPNGLRKDLAEKLESANFKFLRFPGGNNLEGYSIARRWKWWETIGPLKDRPGRPGDWSYFNTDGLGLLEYMYWCEDMDLVPMLAVYAGFSLDVADYDSGNSTDSNEIPLDMMGPVLQEAFNELEFLTGDPYTTYWGAKRGEYGHSEPFDIPFVEIGNEDFFSHDYPARAQFMYEGLKIRYPDITYIYSAKSNRKFNMTLPKGVIWDSHIYSGANNYIKKFKQFDNWQERTNNSGVFASVLEYHVNGIDDTLDEPPFDNITVEAKEERPAMLSAVAEAVYALGWERNPNVVKLACFAPLIQNAHIWRHTPYLLRFDADPRNTDVSTSYYQEQMFNLYQGTETLSVTNSYGDFDPLFWHASIQEDEVYLKVVNAGNTSEPLDVRLDVGYRSMNGTTMHAGSTCDAVDQYAPIVPSAIQGLEEFELESSKREEKFSWTVPPWSVNVLQFDLVVTRC